MKRHLLLFPILSLIFMIAVGCGKNRLPQPDKNAPQTGGSSATDTTVDVDLTCMSSTMVYAEVYNIMTKPDNYMGKTIKMSGSYNALYSGETGLYYHYVIIEDAAACCVQGLEFVWEGEHTYPDDYPEEKTKIEVVGVFGSYYEEGKLYYCVTIEELTVI